MENILPRTVKNKIQLFTVIIICLFVFASCGNRSTLNSSPSTQNTERTALADKGLKSNLSDLKNLTPAQIIEEYINSLKNGNAKEINSLLSKRFLTTVNDSKGYDTIQKQKITNVEIKVDDTKTSTDNEANYILSFTLEDESTPPFFMSGKGKYLFFVKLVSEDSYWKIDGLATSP